MNSNNKDQKEKKETWLISLFIIGIVVLWFLFPWALKYLTDFFQWNIRNTEDTNFGTFGDTYGALNTLFSGLAFSTLIITLILQRKELQLQRKAVQDQHLEIQRSNQIADQQRIIADQQATLINEQIREAQRQNFYTLLFKFFDEKNNRKQRLIVRYKVAILSDVHNDGVFKVFSTQFLKYLTSSTISLSSEEYSSNIQTKREERIYTLLQGYISKCNETSMTFEDSSYFEYILFILDYINQNIHLIERNNIINTFLSFFTFHETICMACIAVTRISKLEMYINKFGLLRNLDKNLLDPSQLHNLELLFENSAFHKIPTANLDFLNKL